MLVFLLPATAISLLFLVGSARWAYRAQANVALQARLDACAVSLALVRSRLAEDLRSTNHALRWTALAITAARAGQLVTGPAGKILGSVSVPMLLRINQGAARWQQIMINLASGRELAGRVCATDKFSRSPAWCDTEPSIRRSLKREPGVFGDVTQPAYFEAPGPTIARVRCRGGALETKMRVEGDRLLTHGSYVDQYEK